MFTNYKKRIFIIELERIQIVRRSSEVYLDFCPQCRTESDFISLNKATSLFDTSAADLLKFINSNFSHYKTDRRGEVFICLTSFVAVINGKTKNPKVKLLGEK